MYAEVVSVCMRESVCVRVSGVCARPSFFFASECEEVKMIFCARFLKKKKSFEHKKKKKRGRGRKT
jgi:hypothetical protein